MAVVVWIVCGAVLGWLSSRIMAVRSLRMRCVYTVIGVVGAVLGGLLTGLLSEHPNPLHVWNVESWQTAVMGSSLLLFATSRKT